MRNSSDSQPVRQHLAVVRRHRLLIAAVVVVAVAAAVGLSLSSDPLYRTQTTVAFNDESQDLQALGTPAAPSPTPDKRAAAQATTITSFAVARRVVRSLGLDVAERELQDAVSAEVEPASALVVISATWETPRGAARIANEFARQARDVLTEESRERYRSAAEDLQERARALRGEADGATRAVYADQASRLLTLANFSRPVEIVRAADVPQAPTSPRPVRNSVLAGALGLLLGLVAAFVRDSLDRRIRSAEDLEGNVDLPVVGYLRDDLLGRSPVMDNGLPALADEDFEPVRILRQNLAFLHEGGPPRTVIVTSPLPEEGKSTVASALAYVEALGGRRTLLVDCDLRKPTVATRYGMRPTPGLSDLLLGQGEVSDLVQRVSLPAARTADGSEQARPEASLLPHGERFALDCISAGTPTRHAVELLDSDRFGAFLHEIVQTYDLVLLDTPPLLPVGDTLGLLPHVDAVLVCLREGKTTMDEAAAAQTTLSHYAVRSSGLVITGVRPGTDASYYGYYAYAHTYPVAPR